ncbi:MAG: dephospho-CoA kinase, partial [Clostridia bacterium]|nr:dephospho-CoA kinase [Clostridia bacterium]
MVKYVLVTGRSGSGKSTISKALAKLLGYEYLDVDKVQHMIYDDKDILDRTVAMFGSDIFDKSGNVDRKKLGKLVFSDPDKVKVQAFNDMAWVYIEKYVDKLLDSGKPYVLDWILSPITKYWDMDAYKIYVTCSDDKTRFSRIASRDGVDMEYIKNRD